MTKTRPIPFAEFRSFLLGLGYAERSPEDAHVFHRHNKDRLFFRRYRTDEEVDLRDLVSTRSFSTRGGCWTRPPSTPSWHERPRLPEPNQNETRHRRSMPRYRFCQHR